MIFVLSIHHVSWCKLFVVVIFYVLGVIMQETIRLSTKGHPLTLLITSLALLFFFKVWMIRYNILLPAFLVSLRKFKQMLNDIDNSKFSCDKYFSICL